MSEKERCSCSDLHQCGACYEEEARRVESIESERDALKAQLDKEKARRVAAERVLTHPEHYEKYYGAWRKLVPMEER